MSIMKVAGYSLGGASLGVWQSVMVPVPSMSDAADTKPVSRSTTVPAREAGWPERSRRLT